MNRVLALTLVVLAACSSQSQPAPTPGEVQTVPTAPEPRLEVTPPDSVAADFPKAKKEAQEHSTQLVEQGRGVLKTKGKVAAPEAASLFADATKEDPRNAMAYWELGWAQQIGGDFDAALATWKTLKLLDPKFPDIDNFSAIAAARRTEPKLQAQGQAEHPSGDEPALATTPVKKKGKRVEGPRQTRPTSGEAAKDLAKGASEATAPRIPPQ